MFKYLSSSLRLTKPSLASPLLLSKASLISSTCHPLCYPTTTKAFFSSDADVDSSKPHKKAKLNLRDVKTQLRENIPFESKYDATAKQTPITQKPKALRTPEEKAEVETLFQEKQMRDDRQLGLNIVRLSTIEECFKFYQQKALRVKY